MSRTGLCYAACHNCRVARTTVYRRYGSLHGVMLILLDDVWSVNPVADTGSLRGDLIQMARSAQLRKGVNPDLLLEFVASVLAQRALRSTGPQTEDFVEEVVDAVLTGFASSP